LTNSQFFQPAPTVKVSISVIFTAQPYRKETIFEAVEKLHAKLPIEFIENPRFVHGSIVSLQVAADRLLEGAIWMDADVLYPHVLLKRIGRGDANADDNFLERAGSIAKVARDGLALPRSYAAELPPSLTPAPLDVALPAQWRAYGDRAALAELIGAGLGAVLERAGRRDLVIELIESLVVVYPAARDVVGADAFADLTATALAIVDGVLASAPRVSPRGVESQSQAQPV